MGRSRPKILSVGQCLIDQRSLTRWLTTTFDAEILSVDTGQEVLDCLSLGEYDLVLINRIADADGASGIDLIRDLKANPQTADQKLMLVSNYQNVQDQAVELGALPGFGKSNLQSSASIAHMNKALGRS